MKTFPNIATLLAVLIIALSISGYTATKHGNSNANTPSAARLNKQDDSDNNNNVDNAKKFKDICSKICNNGHPCPPECENLLDPWAFDSVQTSVKKRSTGIDGFSFDDYLFLRWLGRDMKRHRLL